MKIAILGAGNVALANAVFLAGEGHDVHLYSAFDDEVQALKQAGKVTYEGVITGTAQVAASGDVEAVMKDAPVVIIAAPAFGHRMLMEAAAPHITAEQTILVHPVTGLSSLILSKLLAERGVRATIVDLSTSLFTTRKTGATSLRILRIKDVLDAAALPADRGADALKLLHELYGERFRLEPNALAISLNNHNPIYHVPPLLCNLSRAEKQEDWIIWENITPGVAKFVKMLDEERVDVVRSFGTTEIPVEEYFRQSFDLDGETVYELTQAIAEKLKGPIGPQEFDHRFITEDVPYALVFYRSLGQVAGISMPLTDSLVTITSALYERDFTQQGHTLAALGLEGCGVEDVLRVSTEGFA